MNPSDGSLHYVGKYPDGIVSLDSPAPDGEDLVLIATDVAAAYLTQDMTSIPSRHEILSKKDLTE